MEATPELQYFGSCAMNLVESSVTNPFHGIESTLMQTMTCCIKVTQNSVSTWDSLQPHRPQTVARRCCHFRTPDLVSTSAPWQLAMAFVWETRQRTRHTLRIAGRISKQKLIAVAVSLFLTFCGCCAPQTATPTATASAATSSNQTKHTRPKQHPTAEMQDLHPY